MLCDSDRDKFVQSQSSNIAGLQKMDVFEVHPMQTKATNAHLLSSIWSYKRKWSPVGTILKHKSWLCVDGSQQQHGREFWETYAPVMSWPMICLILLLANILNLKSRQVDYTQAFPQAPLQDPVFMWMPQGWCANSTGTLCPHSDPTYHDRDHYIKLKKNIYWLQTSSQKLQNQASKPMIFSSLLLILAYTSEMIV